MKRLAQAAAALAALIITASAAPPIVYDVEADFQQTQTLIPQSFRKGASVELHYRLRSRGAWLDLSDYGARWEGRSSGTSTQALQSVGTVVTSTTPHYFNIELDSTETGTAVTNWVYSLIVVDDGYDYPLGEGVLNIDNSAWTGPAAILTTTTAKAYTDAAIAEHAAVPATTDSLGHVIVGTGLSVTTGGVLSADAAGLTLQDVTDNGDTTTGAVRAATLQVTGGGGTFGQMTHNDAEQTIDVDLGTTSGQMFQELHWPVKNTTGTTITNGTLVYIIGTEGASGNILAAPYIADGSILSGYMLGVATEDIAPDEVGKATVHGKVRGIDTSAYAEQQVLYASWLTAGGFETNPPPRGTGQYLPVAVVINSHAQTGTIAVRVTPIDLNLWTPAAYNLADGLTLDRQSCYITNIAGTVYFETEKIGGGDIRAVFGANTYTLDCTTGSGVGGRARVALTAGTDGVPVANYIYLTQDGTAASLAASTSFPSGEFAQLGKVVLRSAATTLAEGPLALQRYSDDITRSGGRGRVDYMSERIRAQGAVWYDGAQLTATDDAAGSITVSTTSGIVYQMHRQTFPAIADPATIHVANDPDGNYNTIADLADITKTADGSTIGNRRYYGVRIIGFAASGDDGESRLFAQLPDGVYISEDNALSDADGFDVNTIDRDLRGGAFNVARVVLYKNNSGTVSLVATQDKRGELINALGTGGGASAAQTFPDSSFRVYDSDDVTKLIAFDAGNITTATTRTYTYPDASGTLALLADLAAYLPLAGGEMDDGATISVDTSLTLSATGTTARVVLGPLATAIGYDTAGAGQIFAFLNGLIDFDGTGTALTTNITIDGSGPSINEFETTITDTDSALATSGAIVDYVAANAGAGGYQTRAITTDFIPTDTDFDIVETNGWAYAMPDAGASIASPETFVQKKWRLSPSETNLYVNGSWYADLTGSYTNIYTANGTAVTQTVSSISTDYANPTKHSVNIAVDPDDIWVTFTIDYIGGSVATDYYHEFEAGTNK